MTDNTDLDKACKEVRLNIEKCKMQLMMQGNTTFFSALLANLELVISTEVPTAATNGVQLWMNPYFALEQTLPKLLGLILHEVMHVAYEHVFMYSKEDYPNINQKILNIAQDHYINIPLLVSGYELPDDGYADFNYKNKSSMEIYNILMKNPPPDYEDFDMDVKAVPKDSAEEHKETVISNITKAVTQAELSNDYGSIPGAVSRSLKKVLNPELPWNVILQNYLSAYAKDDYSWSRPNKRFQPDFYLPSLHSESIEQIVCGCDVSASMSQSDLNKIGSEIQYIYSTMHPDELRLMTFDTKVHLDETYKNSAKLDDLVLEGGGGTKVQPLLNVIRKENPTFALIFTDGEFSRPNTDGIISDVFWIIKGNPRFLPPTGVVIPFK